MRAANNLTASQLIERIEELERLHDRAVGSLATVDDVIDLMKSRLDELRASLNKRTKPNFNQGVINPLPPDAVDLNNPAVVTPKPPAQLEREYKEWAESQ